MTTTPTPASQPTPGTEPTTFHGGRINPHAHDDDQGFEREAERRINNAGLGGSAINQNATSILDLFEADLQHQEGAK